MEIKKYYLTKNDCYKARKTMIPTGIVVHSTGANNPNLKRYVQPDDGILGKNTGGNDWNRSGVSKCVNAFIGKDKNGNVRCYQTLPWNYRPWGCGTGSKGSYNSNHIQFEICEDALTDEKYFNEAFALAIELCKYLMKKYNIKASDVVGHHEAHLEGYASNHVDPDHWLKKFGKNMDWFRSQLTTTNNQSKSTSSSYKVKVTANSLNVRAGAGTSYKVTATVKKNEVYTIVDEKTNGSTKWGKLKSGAGWISLKYTTKC